MKYQIQYSVTNTGLLKDTCEHTGYLIGGYDCVNCKHFSHKCKKTSFVICSLKHTKK
jgi:hypothetical protein